MKYIFYYELFHNFKNYIYEYIFDRAKNLNENVQYKNKLDRKKSDNKPMQVYNYMTAISAVICWG